MINLNKYYDLGVKKILTRLRSYKLSILNFIQRSDVRDSLSLTSNDEDSLQKLLGQLHGLDLYETFKNNEVTSDIVFKLTEKHLKEMGIVIGRRFRFLEERSKYEAKIKGT